jgi:hypothetical protein
LVYLVLRIGDAGLMVGVLALWSATGSLEISPALEAGKALPPATLGWIVGGLLLAVWVKAGGWPMHVWQRAGRLLSLFTRTWLYRTLMPNLGFYLLYRVTPLIAASAPLQTLSLWVGALGAAWAAFLTLAVWVFGLERPWPARLDAAMVFLGAVQSGLVLVLAALGLNTTVWLALLVLTPLRVLLLLSGDTAHKATTAGGRRVASVLFGLGSLALILFDALLLWWMQSGGSAGIALAPRLAVEGAVGLTVAWASVTAVALWRGAAVESGTRYPTGRRWTMLSLLACGLGTAFLWRAPLLDRLAHLSHGAAFPCPDVSSAWQFLVASPVLWLALVLGLVVQRLASKGSLRASVRYLERRSDPARALERGVRNGALALRAGIEAGALRGVLGGVSRGVLGAAHFAHRWIEGVVLEGTTRQIAQTTAESGRLAYWVMEQGGLEGLLRRIVRTVMAGSRWLQRQHTGRLRCNLVWVVATLALAVLALILYVW